MKTNYVPHPVDTSDVRLPEELNMLVERMAENVHEVWAKTVWSKGGLMGRSVAMP